MRTRSARDVAVGEVRHGQGPGSDGGVELALEGLELEGVVERAAAVPHGGLGPLDLDREPLQRRRLLHFVSQPITAKKQRLRGGGGGGVVVSYKGHLQGWREEGSSLIDERETAVAMVTAVMVMVGDERCCISFEETSRRR